jgi:cytochrome b561
LNTLPPRYSTTAIVLHWLLAAAILASLLVGNFMSDLPVSPLRLRLANWHKWAGITILALSLLRLAWRLTHRPPPTCRWRAGSKRGARHTGRCTCCSAVPFAGWAYSSAAGFPVVWFGVLALPDFVAPDKALAELLRPLHALLAYLLAALVAVHVAAAIKHHFVDHDGLLARMGLGGGRP